METEAEWLARYGTWEPLNLAGVRALMDGFAGYWWVVGGYAIQAFTGVVREHDDVDVAFFFKDLDAFREHIGGRFHLWAVGSGALRPFDDRFSELPEWAGQLWMRKDAHSPWLADFNLQLMEGGLWVSKRDSGHRLPPAEASWLHRDGIRYQPPEIVLLHKAKDSRPKDRADLDAAWPLLSTKRQAWLAEAIARLYPGHEWLPLLV